MREAIGKRLRFEIFKRDGFRCAYCGATPVQSPLHVDHVQPVAAGGTNDVGDLVTACDSCNLGKGAVLLSDKRLTPTIATDAQLEQVEQIRAYLALQAEIQQAKDAVVDALMDHWRARLNVPADLRHRLPFMIDQVGVDKVMKAIDATASKADRMHSAGRRWTTTDAVMSLNGCIRNMRAGR